MLLIIQTLLDISCIISNNLSPASPNPVGNNRNCSKTFARASSSESPALVHGGTIGVENFAEIHSASTPKQPNIRRNFVFNHQSLPNLSPQPRYRGDIRYACLFIYGYGRYILCYYLKYIKFRIKTIPHAKSPLVHHTVIGKSFPSIYAMNQSVDRLSKGKR